MPGRRGGGRSAKTGKRGAAGARTGGARRKFLFRRRKFCKFCEEKVSYIDFKDVRLLQSYIPERGKILPRRTSGTCAAHQRQVMQAIKRARNIALLPYTTD